jgi:hypothetical protein
MHKAISLGLLAGVAALAASLSSPASATPTALSLQQGQASAGVVEGGSAWGELLVRLLAR